MSFFKTKKKFLIFVGGSRGIGNKILKYLNKSYNIYNISRNPSKLQGVQDFTCDISQKDQVQTVFKKIKNAHYLINCAGITLNSKNNISNFEKIVDVNLKGVFYCCYEAFKILRKNKNSSIINFASINGYAGFPSNPGYVSSKGAIISLTRALALDFGKFNVRVNSISPGYINAGMAKKSFKINNLRKARIKRMIIKRYGTPEDLLGLIELLLSDKSNYITGQDFVIDGGWLAKGL